MRIRPPLLAIFMLCSCVAGTAQSTDEISEFLAPFSENPLPTSVEAYRVTIWPTFHSPLMIRVERGTLGPRLSLKILKGQGGYQSGPPKIREEKTFPLSEKEFLRIREVFRMAGLQTMTGRDEKYDPPTGETAWICLDGANWLVEQVINGEYRNVQRTCPEEKKLHDIGYEFLKISKLRIKREELF